MRGHDLAYCRREVAAACVAQFGDAVIHAPQESTLCIPGLAGKRLGSGRGRAAKIARSNPAVSSVTKRHRIVFSDSESEIEAKEKGLHIGYEQAFAFHSLKPSTREQSANIR